MCIREIEGETLSKMTRKRGAQDGAGVQMQRGPKDKASQAAAKLERFAHTPNHTPKKGGQAGGVQHQGPQVGHPGGRKSQGLAAGASATVTESASHAVLVGEDELSRELAEGIGVLASESEKEPSLKEILLAVNYKSSIFDLSDQLKCFRDELLSLRHDVQEVCARTTALEGRLSQVEDYVNPMRKEVILMRDQLDMCMHKMDEMENRLHRKNIRVLGFPERSEGNNPIEFMEG